MLLAVLLAIATGVPTQALASKAGEVTGLSGVVVARTPAGQSRVLALKSEVSEGDLIAASGNSYARVKFLDGTEAVLRPGGQVRVVAFKFDEQRPQQDGVVLSLLKGGIRIVTGLTGQRNPDAFRVETPSAIVGIRGTSFGLQFCNNDCAELRAPHGGTPANGLHADVTAGTISLRTQVGSLLIGAGQFGYVQSAAVLPVLVPSPAGVHITLPPEATSPAPRAGTVGEGGGSDCEI